MNNSSLELQRLESNLERLRGRVPDLPISSVLLSRLIQHLGRGMASMLEDGIRPFGLNEPEFRVLATMYAYADSGANPTELCSKTSQSPANMSRISDALVSRELITRGSSPLDRRKTVLRITAKGEDLVRRLMPSLYVPLRAIFGDMNDAEQQRLIDQLRQLGSRMDRALAGDPAEQSE